jgi:phage terminase small subunit
MENHQVQKRKIVGQSGYDLTAMQWLFVNEYLIDFNASAAARRAGYAKSSSSVQGAKLMKDPEVMRAVMDSIAARRDRLGITQDMVVQELAKIAFSNIGYVCSWNDTDVVVKDSEEVPGGAQAAIAEISRVPTEAGMATRIRMYDKLGALNSLAKHLGMFETRHVHTGPGGGPIQYQNLPVEKLKGINQLLIESQKIAAGKN